MIGLLLLLHAASAGPVTYRGALAAESRLFLVPPPEAAQFPGPTVSLVADPEFDVDNDARWLSATVQPFLRMDSHDRDRTHLDLRQAKIEARYRSLELGAGAGQFSWGGLSVARIADVVNQLDLAEDVLPTDKLGQPFVGAGVGTGGLWLQALWLPYQRERTFPGLTGRLRPPNGVDRADPQYENPLGPWQPTFAGRASLSVAAIELGLSAFSGTSREPRFVAQLTDPRVALAYDRLDQAALDLVWVAGPLVIRAEGAGRQWTEERVETWAAGAGLEATAFGLAGSAVDLTLLAEGVIDPRPPGIAVTTNDHDVFLGTRLAANDLAGSELLMGASVDVVTGFAFGRAQIQRRLDDHWKISLEGSTFLGPADLAEWWLLTEDHLQLSFVYHL